MHSVLASRLSIQSTGRCSPVSDPRRWTGIAPAYLCARVGEPPHSISQRRSHLTLRERRERRTERARRSKPGFTISAEPPPAGDWLAASPESRSDPRGSIAGASSHTSTPAILTLCVRVVRRPALHSLIARETKQNDKMKPVIPDPCSSAPFLYEYQFCRRLLCVTSCPVFLSSCCRWEWLKKRAAVVSLRSEAEGSRVYY